MERGWGNYPCMLIFISMSNLTYMTCSIHFKTVGLPHPEQSYKEIAKYQDVYVTILP